MDSAESGSQLLIVGLAPAGRFSQTSGRLAFTSSLLNLLLHYRGQRPENSMQFNRLRGIEAGPNVVLAIAWEGFGKNEHQPAALAESSSGVRAQALLPQGCLV